ncbi:MAG: HAMP domain-containing histidine kinase [Balneolales bacterium]|nr:HAMP domain-containing histidine kinase [Balneolales bacterium]
MRIRNKLSIQFTVLVASILLMLFSLIYYASWSQLRANFYDQLHDRTVTTAYIYLEQDGFSSDLYAAVRERYVRTLPQEIGQLYDMENNIAFIEASDFVPYDEAKIEYIRENYTYPSYFTFSNGRWQSAGIFYPDNQGDFVIIVSAIDEIGRAYLANLVWTLVSGYLISLILLFFAGRFFAAQALKPIPKILSQVNQISPSNLNSRLDIRRENDEIGDLVRTFNLFLDRLEESFKSQKRFVANASHELRTPLTSIIGEIEVTLKKQRSTDEYVEVLNSIRQDTFTLHELITGLLNLAEAEAEKMHEMFKPIRVDEVAIEAGMLIEKKYPGSKVIVNYLGINTSGDHFIIPANRPLLFNAFANIIDNAIKFSPDNQVAELSLDASKDTILFSVKDSGIGIPENEIGNIFAPFYRAKDAVSFKGYGIGLSLVERILTILKGEIQISSVPGNGTIVTVAFKK